MLKSRHIIVPFIISPDGQPVSDDDRWVLRDLRLELMDWWASFGHGLLILEPKPQITGRPLADFVAQPHGAGARFAFDHYPIVDNADLTVLYAIRGIDSAIIGASAGETVPVFGQGALQYALVAWDVLQAAKGSEAGRRRLAAIVAHELGHAAFGWQHDYQTPHNIMGPWWSYPAAGMPAANLTQFRVLSVGATPSTGSCPTPPDEPGQ